jgi:ribulose-phosphate 3-epimerase
MAPAIEIIPTVVPRALEDVLQTAARFASFAHTIHIDIADGTFAPNTTWLAEGALEASDGLTKQLFRRDAGSPLDITYEAHLMVSLPREVGLACIAAGASRIIGHIEAMQSETPAIFSAWKAAGAAEVGLGILFQTPIETLDPYIKMCDVVQMMSIASIGVQGIPYEESAPARIHALHERYPDLLIADDGGVSEKNIAELARAGVRRFCVGSALSHSGDSASTYRSLAALAESGVQ